MIWEHRVAIVLVLTAGGSEPQFWPVEEESEYFPLVVGGQWHDDSLVVTTNAESSSVGVAGLAEYSVALHSYVDQQTDVVNILHFPHWPENGEQALMFCY